MKHFSIFSIIVPTLLIGYFFIVGLPKIASTGNIITKKPLQGMETAKNTSIATETAPGKKEPSLATIDACNSLAETKTFDTGAAADSFLESCLQGQASMPTEVTKVPQSTTTSDPATEQSTNQNSITPVTNTDRKERCTDFMSHAKFDSQAAADKFLKNCLTGK